MPREKKSKIIKITLWCIGILAAVVFSVWEFIPFMVALYPISFGLSPAYVVLAVLFPILHFKTKKKIFQTISFVLFALPLIVFIVLLIAIHFGWVIVFE